MNEIEKTLEGYRWLQEQLLKPSLTERRIAQCEKARDTAHDPDIKIIWEGKAQQLRGKRMKEAN
jgi:hypothetical protein|tara:strand:- start:122 stop:313 length:192 start_codon:yes stop_codon:yes gene_type:complete